MGGRMTDTPSTPAGWYPAPHANNEQRYWDGNQWTDWTPESAAAAAQASAAQAADAAAAAPSSPTTELTDEPVKKKKTPPWWVWVLIGIGVLVLLIIIIGSLSWNNADDDDARAQPTQSALEEPSEDTRVDTPDVVGMTIAEARAAIEGAGLSFATVAGAGDDWIVMTQTISVPAEPGTEVFVTAENPAPPAPDVATQLYEGTGDNIVDVNITDPAIVTFDCANCTRNTVLKTNGRESLLVNEIGAYRGQKLINTNDGSAVTRFTVEANGNWSITVEDLTTAEQFTGAAAGRGDRVIFMAGTFDAAEITNNGERNFVVLAYGDASGSPLIVNEIGAYQGTVEMVGPAFVEVTSTGDWSITPR